MAAMAALAFSVTASALLGEAAEGLIVPVYLVPAAALVFVCAIDFPVLALTFEPVDFRLAAVSGWEAQPTNPAANTATNNAFIVPPDARNRRTQHSSPPHYRNRFALFLGCLRSAASRGREVYNQRVSSGF